MTQVNLVEKHLKRHTKGPGITAAKLASLTGLTVASVYRRVYDLRVKKQMPIFTNTRMVKGQRTKYYRLADATTAVA